jgi:phospholipid/cholesterol/gamma-HCH transport system substrate-binding protein
MEPHFKFRHVNEIAGSLILLVLAALVAAMVWMGRSQRWFRSNVALRIELPATGAAGIRQGSEVYFLGTLMGTVSDVSVDALGRMEARANIRRDFFLFVRKDSSAVVKKKFGVAGDSYFEITRGQGRSLPEAGASIICGDQLQNPLEVAVEDIHARAITVLEKASAGLDAWTRLGQGLGETREGLDRLVARLDSIATSVARGEGTAGKLVADPALADEAHRLLERANEMMGEMRGVVTNLGAAVKNVETGTARLPEITDAVASEAKDLPGLVFQTQVSMREIERLVEAMQRQWLLRKLVNHTNPPPVRPRPVKR